MHAETSPGPPNDSSWQPHRSPVLAVGILYVVLTCSAYFVAPLTTSEENWPLHADQVGYYLYLPALLTDGGLSFETFQATGGARWQSFLDHGFSGFYGRSEGTGRLVNAYTPGVALLQAPFFALAHVLALITGAETDGFSPPYLFLAALAGAIYASLGLLFVFLALRARFSERVAGAVVLILGLGTNLLYYATMEPVMTHAYSFCAFSALVWATLAWERSPRLLFAVIAGVALGTVIVIRPTNGVVALVPLGYLAARKLQDGVPEDTRLLVRHLAVASAVAFVCSLPLFSYWRFATGEWITNPFGPGTFYLDDPQIGGVLWSYRKGWFLYTPIMLSAIPGLLLLPRYVPRMALPLVACAASMIYIAASHWNWWFGGSYGMRAIIELSSPLALAVAAVVAWGHAGRLRRRALAGIFGVLIALNIFQTYQYLAGYIHWDGTTRETYWSVFLRPWIPPDEMSEIRAGWDRELPRLPRSSP